MFTGIVEEVGTITAAVPQANGVRLTVAAQRVVEDLRPGASVALNGVCQTVLAAEARAFQVAAESETLRVTTLGALRPGNRVNLERALRADGRFDGHLVLGHVDGRARVVGVHEEGRTRVVQLEVPPDLRPYVVPKGCIAVDGVSLTVGPRLQDGRFELFLIPYTWEHTALRELRAGHQVNVETDIVGRYVAHLLGRAGEPGAPGLAREALERAFGRDAGGAA